MPLDDSQQQDSQAPQQPSQSSLPPQADVIKGVQAARDYGYSDDEIADVLLKHPTIGPKIQQLADDGHDYKDIFANFGMADYDPLKHSAAGRLGVAAAQSAAEMTGKGMQGAAELSDLRSVYQPWYEGYAQYPDMPDDQKQQFRTAIEKDDKLTRIDKNQMQSRLSDLDEGAKPVPFDQFANVPVEQSGLYKAGKATEKFAQQEFYLNPAEEDTKSAKVGHGVGPVLPAIAANLAGPEIGVPATAALFGTSSATDQYDDAKAKNATDEQASTAAQRAGMVGAATGLLDVGAVLKPIERAAPGILPWATAMVKKAAESGLIGASVSEAQDWLNTQIAKVYDPKSEYKFDPDRMAYAFTSMAIPGAAFGAFSKMRPQAPDTTDTEQTGTNEGQKPPSPGAPPSGEQASTAAAEPTAEQPLTEKAIQAVADLDPGAAMGPARMRKLAGLDPEDDVSDVRDALLARGLIAKKGTGFVVAPKAETTADAAPQKPSKQTTGTADELVQIAAANLPPLTLPGDEAQSGDATEASNPGPSVPGQSGASGIVAGDGAPLTPATPWEPHYNSAVDAVSRGTFSLKPDVLADKLNVDDQTAQRLLQAMASRGAIRQIPDGTFRRNPSSGPLDMLQFLASKGGIRDDEGHDIASGMGAPRFIPRYGVLVRPGGMGIDQAGEALWNAGYFGIPDETERPAEADVLNRLSAAFSGRKIYSEWDRDRLQAIQDQRDISQAKNVDKDNISAIDRHAEALDLSLSPEDKARALEYTRQGMDPADAVEHVHEDVAIRAGLAMADTAKEAADQEHEIPFDTGPAPTVDRRIPQSGGQPEISQPRSEEASAAPGGGDGAGGQPVQNHEDEGDPFSLSESANQYAPPFYSALTKSVEAIPQAKAAPGQWQAMLKNLTQKGVKPEELDWSGVHDWLARQDGPVSKNDLLDYLRANELQIQEVTKQNDDAPPTWGRVEGGDARYAEYTLPGGRNYREMLLTLPDTSRDRIVPSKSVVALHANQWNSLNAQIAALDAQHRQLWRTDNFDEMNRIAKATRELSDEREALHSRMVDETISESGGRLGNEAYKSSHWEEPNVVAHVRFDDREGPKGEKILHVAEIQSDLHQEGRKRGYQGRSPDTTGWTAKPADASNPNSFNVRDADNQSVGTFLADSPEHAIKQATEEIRKSGVPNLPFKTSWPELAFKRILRYAAEHGYDRVTWDTGETNAERYDLSKKISRVRLSKTSSGSYLPPEGPFENGLLEAFDHDGRKVLSQYIHDPSNLPNVVGKEIADRLINAPEKESRVGGIGARVRELSGLDLKIGGEGMKSFYDRILPAAVNKLVKKWGGKTGTSEFPEGRLRYEGPVPTDVQLETVDKWLSKSHSLDDDDTVSPVTGRWLVFPSSENDVHLFNNLLHAIDVGQEDFATAMRNHGNGYLADLFGGDLVGSPVSVHSIDITPAMREAAIREGFPLFERKQSDKGPMLPGFEPPTTKEKLEARANVPLRGGNKPLDQNSLFGDAHKQADLVELARQKATEPIRGLGGEHPDWATAHARDLNGGQVVYSDPEVALVRAGNYAGKPVYVGIDKASGNRTRIDIDDFNGRIFTPEQKARLSAAKAEFIKDAAPIPGGNRGLAFATFHEERSAGDSEWFDNPEQKHLSAADFVKARGRATKNEHLVAVDQNGDVVHAMTSYLPQKIIPDKDLAVAMDDPKRNIVIHHNHPMSSALSIDDIGALFSRGVRWIVAHGHAGNLSAARFSDSMRGILDGMQSSSARRAIFDQLKDRYEKIDRRLAGVIGAAFHRGEITADQANRAQREIMNHALADAGIIDYTSTEGIGLPETIHREALGAIAPMVRTLKQAHPSLKALPDAQFDRHPGAVLFGEGIRRLLPGREGEVAKAADQTGPGSGGHGASKSGDTSQIRPKQLRLLESEAHERGLDPLTFAEEDPRYSDEERRGASTISRIVNHIEQNSRGPGRGPLVRPVQFIEATAKILNDSTVGQLVRHYISPGAYDQYAKVAARTIRSVMGGNYLRNIRMDHAFKDAVALMDNADRETKDNFAIAMDTGNFSTLPEEMRTIAQNLKRVTQEATQRIQSLGVGALDDAKENYLGRIWKQEGRNPAIGDNEEKTILARLMSKRPLTGSKSFLKQRYYDTYQEAREAGLEPVFDNPITTQLIKLREMNRFYAGTIVAQVAKKNEYARFFKTGRAKPQGWQELQGKEFHRPTIITKNADGTTTAVPEGAWFAPEGFSLVYNNFVSRGAEATRAASAYRAVRDAENFMNSFQLGLSAFHPVAVSLEAVMTQVQQGVGQVFGHGEFGKGLATIATAPSAPYTAFRDGNRLLKTIYDPAAGTTPEQQRLAQAFAAAGGRVTMDRILQPTDEGPIRISKQYFSDFGKAIQAAGRKYPDSPIRAAFNIAGRTMQGFSSPIMDELVPRLKLGAFSRLANDWLTYHPNSSTTEFTAAMQDIWDTVDNRMGELVYDNLFWKKGLKDASFLTLRSVGWNMGTLREIGGGVYEGAKYVLDKGAGRQSAEWTNRMGYLIALPMVTAMVGAIYQKLATGNGPDTLKDYFFPQTGNTITKKIGTQIMTFPERISLPGYMKDVYAWTQRPEQTAKNKLNPMFPFIAAGWDIVTGQDAMDFYGDLIMNHDDPVVKQVWDGLSWAASEFAPFSVTGTIRMAREGASLSKLGMSMSGLQPAPGYIAAPEAEKAWEERRHRELVSKTKKDQKKRPPLVAYPLQ